jgi:hypothetical protein
VTETVAATPDPASVGLFSRLVGIIFSPRETYAAVAARPRWLGMMAITLLIGAGAQYIILSSPELQDAIIDQQIVAMQQGGGAVSDQQIAGVETFIRRLPIIYGVAAFIIGPVITAMIAGLLMVVFTMIMGGAGTFRQLFAIVTHAGVISLLAGIFSALLVLAGVPPSGVQPPSASLGVFVPMLEETSFVAIFLGTINLILVWWLLSLAIGLGVLYRRRTGPIATALISVYVIIALIIAVVRT